MSKSKYTSIGGQALIEGIMMRGPEKTAVAVRLPDGGIDISYQNFSTVKERFPFLKLPVIRGVVNFVESMVQGYKALSISAEKSGFADEEETADKNTKTDQKNSGIMMGAVMAVATVLAVILSVFLFMYIPALLFDLIKKAVGDGIMPFKSLFEGIIKLLVLVAYMFAVSRMKDIKRVFMYHGAEHKTIFCFESGKELTVENVRPMRRFHPRCGTSFLILMVLVSVIVSSLIAIVFPAVTKIRLVWVLVKILMIPIICGLGYELIKICGRYDNLFTKIVSAPGMWLQRITTCEPDDSMIEVAIASLKAVIPENSEEDR